MAATTDDDIKIYAPDTSLKKKLGPGVTFESLVTPSVLRAAEQVVTDMRPTILQEIEDEMRSLKNAFDILAIGSPAERLVPVVTAAFSIKSKAGFCGYAFASELARSLHVFCELDAVRAMPLTPKIIDIINCHVRGLQTIFAQKITGDGGAVGAEIMRELDKLTDKHGFSIDKSP